MLRTCNIRHHMTIVLIMITLSWIMMNGTVQAADTRSGGPDKDRSRDSKHQIERSRPSGGDHTGRIIDKHSGATVPRVKGAVPGHRHFMDSRYHHDRSYPVRGHHIGRLPSGHREVIYHKDRYYFHGGIWYRPYGARFVVVAPPFGLVIPFLPPYYSTIWVSGIPYYYANDVYYAAREGGYMVVEPPQGEATEEPPASTSNQIFIYPRNGQSEKQQANDRYECHRWAVDQTSYDPTQPAGNKTPAESHEKRADYQRAMAACLDARGYTVK